MTDEELKEQFGAISARFDGMDTQFETIDARFDAIKADIAAEGINTRRHFDVVAESLRANIKIIAEGHDVLRQDVAELKAAQQRRNKRS